MVLLTQFLAAARFQSFSSIALKERGIRVNGQENRGSCLVTVLTWRS